MSAAVIASSTPDTAAASFAASEESRQRRPSVSQTRHRRRARAPRVGATTFPSDPAAARARRTPPPRATLGAPRFRGVRGDARSLLLGGARFAAAGASPPLTQRRRGDFAAARPAPASPPRGLHRRQHLLLRAHSSLATLSASPSSALRCLFLSPPRTASRSRRAFARRAFLRDGGGDGRLRQRALRPSPPRAAPPPL